MSKIIRFNAAAAAARFLMECRGHSSNELVHETPWGISSPITLEDYQRGGYTSRYYSLRDVAGNCLPYEEFDTVELPRGECPKTVKGGFNRAVTVYTVDKSGVATIVACSSACTYRGDLPSAEVEVPQAPRIMLEYATHGNGSSVSHRYYS